ncbi:MAG TPA: ABC transporter ATP-binding protein [Acidimicrobiaceae bacterium]|nr:ABC transporter ATP-binding protein [Acidimicrobiaceae bacterium]
MAESHWGFVASLLRPHRAAFFAYGLILAVATALPIVGALMVAHFVSLVVDGATVAEVAPYGLGYAGIGLASATFGVVVTWRSTDLAWRVTNELRNDLVGHVLEADLAFHRDRTPGELLTRCDADVTALTNFLASVVARVIGIALLAVSSTVVLAFVEPRLAAVLGVGYVVLGWVMWRVKDLSADAVIAERTIDAEMNSVAEQYLAGADDVATLGAGAHGLRRFGDAAARLVDAAGVRVRAEMRVQTAIKTVMAVAMIAVLAVGGLGLNRGWVEVAGVVLAFRLVQIVRSPVEHLTWRLQEAQGVAGAARRILELVDERSAVVAGTGDLPPGPLDVRFDGVGLVYDDSHDGSAALEALHLHVPAGRVLGLVGRTGSGKTTVARLLLRLVEPTSGTVQLGGTDIAGVDDDRFRTRVVAIPQDVQLFPGTVRDNVTMFAPVDDAAVTAALGDVGLGRWLADLPAGLDTVLSSDGRTDTGSSTGAAPRVGMSAGQAQLLAIARALLRAPDVIVLDEATSRVDPITQAAIGEALARLVEGRTAVIIAHRLETLDACDDIAVLADGALVEHGPRAELAAQPESRYARLRAVGADAGELA